MKPRGWGVSALPSEWNNAEPSASFSLVINSLDKPPPPPRPPPSPRSRAHTVTWIKRKWNAYNLKSICLSRLDSARLTCSIRDACQTEACLRCFGDWTVFHETHENTGTSFASHRAACCSKSWQPCNAFVWMCLFVPVQLRAHGFVINYSLLI